MSNIISIPVNENFRYYFFKKIVSDFGLAYYQHLNNISNQGIVNPTYDKIIMSSVVGKNSQIQSDTFIPNKDMKLVIDAESSVVSDSISFTIYENSVSIMTQKLDVLRKKYEVQLTKGKTYRINFVVNNMVGYIHIYDIHLECPR